MDISRLATWNVEIDGRTRHIIAIDWTTVDGTVRHELADTPGSGTADTPTLTVLTHDSEQDVIGAFVAELSHAAQLGTVEVLAGWYDSMFDVVVLAERADALGIDLPLTLTPFAGREPRYEQLARLGGTAGPFRVSLCGLDHIDAHFATQATTPTARTLRAAVADRIGDDVHWTSPRPDDSRLIRDVITVDFATAEERLLAAMD